MVSAFFKLMLIVTALFFAFNAFTNGQWKRGDSSFFAPPSQDEDCPEKFPENKTSAEVSDDDYVAFQHQDFSPVSLEADISKHYPLPSTPFPNNSYCEITTPPPRT